MKISRINNAHHRSGIGGQPRFRRWDTPCPPGTMSSGCSELIIGVIMSLEFERFWLHSVTKVIQL